MDAGSGVLQSTTTMIEHDKQRSRIGSVPVRSLTIPLKGYMNAGVKFALAKLLAELYGTGRFSVIFGAATGLGRYGFSRAQEDAVRLRPVIRSAAAVCGESSDIIVGSQRRGAR